MDVNIIIGILGLVLAIVGIDYARKSYKKDHVEKPNEEKIHLLAQFKANQKLSRQTYEVLQKFTTYYNAYDKEVWPGQGITYKTYLDEIKKSHEEGNLSDVVYEQIVNSELTTVRIHSHIKSLEQQFEALNMIYQEFRIKTQNL